MSHFPRGDEVAGVYRDGAQGSHIDPGTHFGSSSIDSRARNALTLGVFSLIFGVLTGVPAIWLGRNALIHIHESDGAVKGRWAAWAAIVLGLVGIVVTIASLNYFR